MKKLNNLRKLSLSEFSKSMNKEQMRLLVGGSYLCSCNGSPAGSASTPEGCIKNCGW